MDIRVVDVEYNDDDGYDVHAYLKVSEDTTEEEVEDYLYEHSNIEVYVNGFDTLNVKNASKYKDYDFVTYVDEPDDSVFEGVARNFSDALIEEYMDDYYNDDNCILYITLSYGTHDDVVLINNKKGTKEELTKDIIKIINSIDNRNDLDALDIIFNWLEDDGELSDAILSLSSVNILTGTSGNHDYIYNDEEVTEEVLDALTAKYQELQ